MPLMEGVNPGDAHDHDPTIAYHPEAAEPPGDFEPRVEGAFGYALIIEKGPRAGMTFILAPGTTTVGRSGEANIFLDDVTVSRKQAQLHLEDASLVIEDLGSTNGTYVNGVRTDHAELHPGDEVILGKYHLIVARGDG